MLDHKEYLLDNGVRVFIVSREKTPRIAIDISVRGGIKEEQYPGLLRMAARLSLKGTEKYSYDDIVTIIDNNALSITHSILSDYSILRCTALNDKFETVIDLLSDILLRPSFDKFDDELALLAGELQFALDMPGELCADTLERTFHQNHPYGYTASVILENIALMKKEEMRENYHKYLVPDKISIVIVGDFTDINEKKIVDKLNLLFGSFCKESQRTSNIEKSAILTKKDILVTKILPSTNQAHYMTAWQSVKRGHENQAAMTMFSNILGGAGLTTRLFLELRDKEGLAYGVHSHYTPYESIGQFTVAISTTPANILHVKKGFEREIQKLQNELVSEEELNRVKTKLISRQLIASQTNTNIALNATNGIACGFGIKFISELFKKIEKVNSEDVLSAAKSVVPPSVTTIISANEDDFLPVK